MSSVSILFLGAGKRLTLLEYFRAAALAENLSLSLWAVEMSDKVPISVSANILVGPRFEDPEFDAFLLQTTARLKIDMVIPNMDSATVALSRLQPRLCQQGTWAVVSDPGLCTTMYDKFAAEQWFLQHSIPIPLGDGYSRIAKRRFGFGSRDQFIARDEAELQLFLSRRDPADYLVQPCVEGQEYTVDAYVDRSGRFLVALSRKRLEVIAGEVDVSLTHHHPGILSWTGRILSLGGWQGPITLQFIDSPAGPLAVEINPRFGGGVTHSIHCGVDMPRWLLREQLGLPIEPPPDWPDGSLMTRCRRDIYL